MLRSLMICGAVAALAGAAPADAAQRTFVRSDGSDLDPCTLAQPCRGFAAAIALTDPNGEIVALDSAGYGTVTVGKAVSIIAPPGVYAGISVSGGQDGVTVNAGPADKVVLRGLSINGQGGDHGIVVTGARQLHIEGCEIANMGGDGIQVNGGTAVYVANSTVRSNAANGIRLSGLTTAAFVDDTRIADNGLRGILQEGGSLVANRATVENNGVSGLELNPATTTTLRAAVRDSTFADNGIAGIFANTIAAGEIVNVSVEGTAAMRNGSTGFAANSLAGGTINVVLSHSASIDNGGNGLFAAGSGTTASVSASTLSRNTTSGLGQSSGSTLRSHQNNAVNGNGGAETTGTITNVGLL